MVCVATSPGLQLYKLHCGHPANLRTLEDSAKSEESNTLPNEEKDWSSHCKERDHAGAALGQDYDRPRSEGWLFWPTTGHRCRPAIVQNKGSHLLHEDVAHFHWQHADNRSAQKANPISNSFWENALWRTQIGESYALN